MDRRWSAGLLLVVGSAAVTLGCAEGAEVRAGPDEDRPPGAVLEQGDEIADGFVVAAGTTVPGGAFPTLGGTYDGVETPRNWSAVVEADGNLPEAVGAYAEQARALGFTLHGPADGAACGANVVREVDVMDDVQGQPPAGTPLWVECRVAGERVVGEQLETVEVSAIRSYSSEWGGPSDSFTIGLTRWPSNRGTAPLLPGGSEPPSVPTTASPPPPTVSTLPAAAEGSTISPCHDAVTLERGSRLLGVAYDCVWQSSILVLEVTGDPDEVFSAYVRQLRSAQGFNPPTLEESSSEFDGRAVRVAQIFADDSSYLRVTMLSDDGQPRVMSIQEVSG